MYQVDLVKFWTMTREKKQLSKATQKQLKNLGKKLKALRIEKGYSNYEIFSYENKIGRSQYGKYEQGSDMTVSTLFKLIEIHGLSVKEFFSSGFEW